MCKILITLFFVCLSLENVALASLESIEKKIHHSEKKSSYNQDHDSSDESNGEWVKYKTMSPKEKKIYNGTFEPQDFEKWVEHYKQIKLNYEVKQWIDNEAMTDLGVVLSDNITIYGLDYTKGDRVNPKLLRLKMDKKMTGASFLTSLTQEGFETSKKELGNKLLHEKAELTQFLDTYFTNITDETLRLLVVTDFLDYLNSYVFYYRYTEITDYDYESNESNLVWHFIKSVVSRPFKPRKKKQNVDEKIVWKTSFFTKNYYQIALFDNEVDYFRSQVLSQDDFKSWVNVYQQLKLDDAFLQFSLATKQTSNQVNKPHVFKTGKQLSNIKKQSTVKAFFAQLKQHGVLNSSNKLSYLPTYETQQLLPHIQAFFGELKNTRLRSFAVNELLSFLTSMPNNSYTYKALPTLEQPFNKGLATFPFQNGLTSQIMINGKKTSTLIDASVSDEGSIYLKRFLASHRRIVQTNKHYKGPVNRNNFSESSLIESTLFYELSVGWNEFSEDQKKSAISLFYAHPLQVGFLKKNLEGRVGFGPTFKNSLNQTTSLGYNVTGSFKAYLFNPLSTHIRYSLHQQPNVWNYSLLNFGATVTVNRININVGYQVAFGRYDRIFDGLYLGSGFYF